MNCSCGQSGNTRSASGCCCTSKDGSRRRCNWRMELACQGIGARRKAESSVLWLGCLFLATSERLKRSRYRFFGHLRNDIDWYHHVTIHRRSAVNSQLYRPVSDDAVEVACKVLHIFLSGLPKVHHTAIGEQRVYMAARYVDGEPQDDSLALVDGHVEQHALAAALDKERYVRELLH